jgi:hypothetical protein
VKVRVGVNCATGVGGKLPTQTSPNRPTAGSTLVPSGRARMGVVTTMVPPPLTVTLQV